MKKRKYIKKDEKRGNNRSLGLIKRRIIKMKGQLGFKNKMKTMRRWRLMKKTHLFVNI